MGRTNVHTNAYIFQVGSWCWAVQDSNIISWTGAKSGIQGTKASGFIVQPMCSAVIFFKQIVFIGEFVFIFIYLYNYSNLFFLF